MILEKDNINYSFIDSLRGIAILMVVAVHVSQSRTLMISDFARSFLNFGSKGVQLFFIVSAFTLFMSFNSRLERENHPYINYGIRRFFRIAPMYYLAIIFYTNIILLYPPHKEGIILNVLFLHGWSIQWLNNIVPGSWSVGVEMMFYIILPFIFLKIKNLDQAIKFFIFSVILKALLEYLIRANFKTNNIEELDLFLKFYLPNQLPIFCLGIIAYFIVVRKEQKLSLVKKSTLFMLIGVIGLTLFPKTNVFLDEFIAFGILFLLLVIFMSRSNSIINNWPLQKIGIFSFSIYLSHFAIIHILENFSFYYIKFGGIFDFIYRYLLVIIGTTIFSGIAYYLIEVKFQKIGKALINKLNRTPVNDLNKS